MLVSGKSDHRWAKLLLPHTAACRSTDPKQIGFWPAAGATVSGRDARIRKASASQGTWARLRLTASCP
eukprot:5559574-Alexandrium_andersonii.AAC.1